MLFPKHYNSLEDMLGVMLATDLVRGAFSGKETFLYYNTGPTAVPVWEEIPRARNITTTDGPALTDVEFHGSPNTTQIPGYKAFNGSFELVRKKGTDTVYDALKLISETGEIVEFLHLNGTNLEVASVGWRAPVQLGEFAEVANGNDPVVATIPFGLADAYDGSDNQIGKTPAIGEGPGP